MPLWVIAAAVVSIAITAILTLVLWRMNEGAMRESRQSGGAGDATPYVAAPDAVREDRNNDSHDDRSGGERGEGGDSGAGGDGGGGGDGVDRV